jgi:hypothetical protein
MDWINTFYSKELEWKALPTMADPKGRKGGFKEYYEFAINTLSFFKDRKLKVIRSFVDGNTVIFEQKWSATLPQDINGLKKGDMTKQIVLSIFQIKKGLIIRQTDYMVPTMD